jgi:hypothetical protein
MFGSLPERDFAGCHCVDEQGLSLSEVQEPQTALAQVEHASLQRLN